MAAEPICLDALVRRLRLHADVADVDAAALENLPWKLAYRSQNTQLVREGDATRQCMVLLHGFAHRFRITTDGERQILAVYVPGDPIDFDHVYLPDADDGLQAVRDCTLATIGHEPLRKLMAERPRIAEAIIRALLVDSSIFREWTLNVGRRDARTRIAHLLCEIIVRLEAQNFDFKATPIPLTQDQVADATGLTPVHVNRTMKALKAEKLIERRGGLVIAPDLDALKALAGFDARYLHLLGIDQTPPRRGRASSATANE